MGRPADDVLLAALVPDAETRLSAQAELLEHWVIGESGDAIGFTHDWLGESLLASLDTATRRALHARIAAALASLPDSDPAERMTHAASAGAWDAAFADALAAAERASLNAQPSLSARPLAIAQQAAHELGWHESDARQWPLLKLRERDHESRGDTDASLRALDLMDEIAQSNANAECQAYVLLRRGAWLRHLTRPREAVAALRQAIAIAQRADLGELETRARHALGTVLHDLGEHAAALDEQATALAQAAASGDDALHFDVLSRYAHALMVAGHVGEADALLMKYFPSQTVQRHADLLARLSESVGIVKMAARQYDAAFGWLREGLRRALSLGAGFNVVYAQYHLLKSLVAWGLYDEAHTLASVAIEFAQHQQAHTAECLQRNELARLYLYTGDPSTPSAGQALAQAREHVLASARLIESAQMPQYRAATFALLAQIELARGDVGAALAALPSGDNVDPRFSHIAAQVYLRAGDHTHARHWLQYSDKPLTDVYVGEPYWISGRLWEEAEVIAALDGARAARAWQERAYAHLLDDLAHMQSPDLRRAFVSASPARRALANFHSDGPQRLVWLPAHDAPTGRVLHADELVPVVCTLHAPSDPPLSTTAGRRERLQRLAAEAIAQGAGATVEALAQVLNVSPRTLMRDLEKLRAAGIHVQTRAHARKRAKA